MACIVLTGLKDATNLLKPKFHYIVDFVVISVCSLINCSQDEGSSFLDFAIAEKENFIKNFEFSP